MLPRPPYFDCKEDKEGTSRQVFIDEQKAATSTGMLLIKDKGR